MYTCCVERINYEDFLESEFSCTHTRWTQQKSHGNRTVALHQNNNTQTATASTQRTLMSCLLQSVLSPTHSTPGSWSFSCMCGESHAQACSPTLLYLHPSFVCVCCVCQDVSGSDATGRSSRKVHVPVHRLLHVGGRGAEEHDHGGESACVCSCITLPLLAVVVFACIVPVPCVLMFFLGCVCRWMPSIERRP